MKIAIRFVALAYIGFLVSGSCGCNSNLSQADTRADSAPAQKQRIHPVVTMTYPCKGGNVEVSFSQTNNPYWSMWVRDPRNTYSEAKERTWTSSASLCSQKKLLWIINRSLERFHTKMPTAQLSDMSIDMDVSKELWIEILNGLHKRLSTLPGKKASNHDPKNDNIISDPDEIGDEIQRVVKESAVTKAITMLLRQRGMHITAINAENDDPLFKNFLTGRRWSDIAKLPDAGIDHPGLIEFDINTVLTK